MFYVYEWYIIDTNEVFYVGKGTGSRYKVRKHNNLFNDMIKRFKCESRIVREFEKEDDAFQFEYEYINSKKENGECTCNIRVGGFGGNTEWWTEERRKEYSEHNVMKSENQRKRMQESNPMYDPDTVAKTVAKKQVGVVIGNTEFDSVKDAMSAYNVCYDTIASWCNRGINYHGEKCRWANKEQKEYTNKRYNPGSSKAVVYKGIRYESESDLCNEIGIGSNTLCRWLKRGFSSDGEPCRYENDERNLVFENRHITRNKKRAKAVIVDGVKFNNVAYASEQTGIPKSTIYSTLNGNRTNTKHICVYDNQQPSQTKNQNK